MKIIFSIFIIFNKIKNINLTPKEMNIPKISNIKDTILQLNMTTKLNYNGSKNIDLNKNKKILNYRKNQENMNDNETPDENSNEGSNSATDTTSGEDYTALCESQGQSANSYDDCSKYNDEENNKICCYVTGVSGSTDSSGCLEVHILFLNKTLEYKSDKVSGKLICTSSKQSSFYLSNYLFYFILFFLF